MPQGRFLTTLLLLASLVCCVTLTSARADTLTLTGVLQDGSGRPLPREQFRLVLGSDPAPRNPGAGRMLVTDARGRFSLEAEVSLKPRRVRVDNLFTRHSSLLLEVGFEFDLLGQPALHWVEFDFIEKHGLRRGIETFVARPRGTFDLPLVFHDREHTWSIPGDPKAMRLTTPGADVQVVTSNDSRGGHWRLDLSVIRHTFTLR